MEETNQNNSDNMEKSDQVKEADYSKKSSFSVLAIVALGAVLVIGGWFLLKQKNSSQSNTGSTPTESSDSGSVKGESSDASYTLDEISKHNTRQDCWTTIEGNVYDVTSFISEHPGGDRILQACGIDATDLFTGKSPMGRVHSRVARGILSGLQIGTLSK